MQDPGRILVGNSGSQTLSKFKSSRNQQVSNLAHQLEPISSPRIKSMIYNLLLTTSKSKSLLPDSEKYLVDWETQRIKKDGGAFAMGDYRFWIVSDFQSSMKNLNAFPIQPKSSFGPVSLKNFASILLAHFLNGQCRLKQPLLLLNG